MRFGRSNLLTILGWWSCCATAAFATAPANDNFANRIALTGAAVTANGTNVGASRETNEPLILSNAGGASVWWSWTAPASGTVTIDTIGSSFDTQIGVYTGTAVNALTFKASDNDSGGNLTSSVSFSATSGTVYQISVDGLFSGASVATGTIRLEIFQGTFSPPSISTQPNSNGVATGQTMSYNVGAAASGSLTFGYQWYQNGILLADGTQTVAPLTGEVVSGSTGPVLTLASIPFSASGGDVYVVAANTNGSGSVASTQAGVTVFDAETTSIEAPPVPVTVNAGGTAIFTATAPGGPLPTFVWRKGGVALTSGLQTSGSTVSFSASFDSVAGETTSTLTITNANNTSPGDAGNYDVVAHNIDSTTGLPNPSVTSAAVALTINKVSQVAPTVYATGSMTFGSLYVATTNQGAGAAAWALGTGSTAAGAFVGVSTGIVTSTGLGTVVIKAQFVGDANHNASPYSTSFPVTVSAAPTTFALNNATFTYTGSTQGPTIVPTPSAATFSTTGTLSATNAGSYSVTPTATVNYTGTSGALSWTINQAAATVTLGSLSATYDGSTHAATATTSPAGKTVTFTYNGSATVPTNAGSYAVVGTVNDTNYAGTASGTLTIAKATATVSLGSLSPTYNASPHAATATTTPSGKTVTFTYNGSSTIPTAAGSYAVVGTVSDSNYTGTGSGTLAIAKAPLTVTADAKSRVYGAANPTFTATLSGFAGSDTASVVSGAAALSTSAIPASPVAGYNIVPAVGTLSASNYSFGTFTNGTLTVTKAPLTVTAANKTRLYGANNPAFTVGYSGFANSESASSLTTQPTATSPATLGSAAGAYSIVPAGGVSSNYAFSYVNGTLTIVRPANADFNGDNKSDLVWTNTATGERDLWFLNGTTFAGSDILGSVSSQWQIAATADFNGDGQADILWQNSATGECLIWLMNGGTYLSSVSLGTVPVQWQIAAAADFNNDGQPDILWQNTATGERLVWLMNGTGFASSVSLGVTATPWRIAAAADFNGDGYTDIVLQNTVTGKRVIWLMHGTTFSSSVSLGVFPTQWSIAGTGDYNGDGQPDLVVQNAYTGERRAWMMSGTSISSNVSLGFVDLAWTIGRPAPAFAIAADFNADGDADILWQNTSTGERLVWLMSGTSFSSGVSLGTVPPPWQIAALGDFNGDGRPDLVWQNTSTGERSIWLMNGTSYSSSVSLGVVSTQWTIAGAGDFNGDGQTDILWQNLTTGDRAVWLMNGTSFASNVSLGNLSTQWTIAGTGDFNGDGQTDIVWQNSSTGARTVWLMTGSAFSANAPLGTVATQWSIGGVGDFNGDGQPDILWQNTSTGERLLWLMNGTTYLGSVSLGTVPVQWSIRN